MQQIHRRSRPTEEHPLHTTLILTLQGVNVLRLNHVRVPRQALTCKVW